MGEDEARQERPEAARGRARRWSAAALVVLLGLFAWRALLMPVWEWDLLGYLGCVEELKGASAEEAHASAYGALDEAAPAAAVARLRGQWQGSEADPRGSVPYRRALAENPQAFQAQLPFYRGRVVYLGLLRLAEAAGLAPLSAVRGISLLAGLVFGLVLALWLARYLNWFGALLLTFPGMEWSGVGEAMGLPTPDALAAALLITGGFVLAEKRCHALGIVLLALALATRADHVLLASGLLLWLRVAPPRDRALATPWLAGGLVLLALTTWYCTAGRGTYGWWTVFHHTFVEYQAFPAGDTPPRDIGLALSRVVRSLPMFRAMQPLLFSAIGVLALVVGFRREGWHSRGALLVLVAMAAGLAHFALFPALWPRLMMPYWAVTLVGACAVWGERLRSAQSRSAQASP